MGVRAKLLTTALRRLERPRWSDPSNVAPEALRARMEALTRRAPPPPRFVEITPVDAGGVPAEWVSVPGCRADRVVVYLHGGAFIAGSPRTHRNLTWRLSRAAGARVLALDYRLAPEHPYPAAMEDVLAAHRWLLRGDAVRIAWAGDSAGAGLLFSALQVALREEMPAPRAAVAFSPWTCLAGSGRPWSERESGEAWLTPSLLRSASEHYRGSVAATDPAVSNANAAFDMAPPTLIQVGHAEMLRDDAFAVATRLREAGSHVQLQVWQDVPHVWHLFAPLLRESRAALSDAGFFLRRWW